MKPPRFSVGAVMFGLIVVAADCVIYRSVHARPEFLQQGLPNIILATLPMANLLTIFAASMIRGRAEARASRVGFAVGAFLALVATTIGLTPALHGIEGVLTSLGLDRWLMASPTREMVVLYGVVVGLPLIAQMAAGLIGGRIGSKVGAHRAVGPGADPGRGRSRLPATTFLLLLASVPALTVEGYLRRKVDPMLARIGVGSEAVVDFNHPASLPMRLPKSSTLRQLSGSKVKVESDGEPFLIEQVMTRTKGSKEGRSFTYDRRQVRVTLLDGPRAGEATTMYHCFLRPVR